MKVEYCPHTNTLTISLREARIRESDEVRPGGIVDFGEDGARADRGDRFCDCIGIGVRIAVGGALERSALAGVGGKTPPLRVLFDGNVVMDAYATHRILMRKAMIEDDMQEARFRFDFEGTKILTMH